MIKIKTNEEIQKIIDENGIKIPSVLELRTMTKRQMIIFRNKCRKHGLYMRDINRFIGKPRYYLYDTLSHKKNSQKVSQIHPRAREVVDNSIQLPNNVSEFEKMKPETFFNTLIKLKDAGFTTIDIAKRYNMPYTRFEKIISIQKASYNATLLNKKHPIKLSVDEVAAMNYNELCQWYNDIHQYGWNQYDISRHFGKSIYWLNQLLKRRRKGAQYNRTEPYNQTIHDAELVDTKPVETKPLNRWWYIAAAAVIITTLTIAALV